MNRNNQFYTLLEPPEYQEKIIEFLDRTILM
jgi:hypothetical protein